MRHASIRQRMLMGLVGVLSAMLLLAMGWLFTLDQLQHRKQRIFTDATSLQTALSLELAVATAPQQPAQWEEAARLVQLLPAGATSGEERALVREIDTRFAALMRLRQSGAASQSEVAAQSARLLRVVQRHADLNEQQMQDTMRDGERLERNVRALTFAVLALATLLLIWRGVRFRARIMQPILELS